MHLTQTAAIWNWYCNQGASCVIFGPKKARLHIFDAISDAISLTKPTLPYPARMFFFREGSRGL